MPNDSVFLLKADIKVSDHFLQNLIDRRSSEALNDKFRIEMIAQELFEKKPNQIEILEDGGTFHIIYKLFYDDHKKIVKLALDVPGHDFQACSKQYFLHEYLINHDIKVPRVYRSSNSDSHQYNYIAMDYIEGIRFGDYIEKQEDFSKSVQNLGRQIAQLHQIKVDGFGELFPTQDSNQKIKALFLHWSDFLLTRFDEHLEICKANDYITEADLQSIQSIYNDTQKLVESSESRLLHGDLGSKNIIVQLDQSIYLLDWEDAIGGDPIFDLAMWGSFIANEDKLSHFLEGYYESSVIQADFYVKYYLYKYRILIAKTVHRFRFQYCRNDHVHPSQRLTRTFEKLKDALR